MKGLCLRILFGNYKSMSQPSSISDEGCSSELVTVLRASQDSRRIGSKMWLNIVPLQHYLIRLSTHIRPLKESYVEALQSSVSMNPHKNSIAAK